MPVFTATLSDGRKVRMEADEEPSHEDILKALESWKEPAAGYDEKVSSPSFMEQISQPLRDVAVGTGMMGRSLRGRLQDLVNVGATGIPIEEDEESNVAAAARINAEIQGRVDDRESLKRTGMTAQMRGEAQADARLRELGIEPVPLPEPPPSAPMPVDATIAGMPTIPRLLSGATQATVELLPKIGAMTVAAPVLGAPGAAAATFGFTEEGEFSAASAAIAAALPFIGKHSGQFATRLASRLGIEGKAALGLIDKAGAIVGASVPLVVQGEAEIAGLPDDQKEDARFKLYEGILANAYPGVLHTGKLPAARRPIEINQRPTTGVTDASRVQETTAVHGDLRTQPVAGQRQVPAEEGGAGVQPQAAQAGQEGQQGVLLTLAEKAKAERAAKTRLSEENQRYLDEERAAIDTPVKVVAEIPEGHPFAGLVASIDPKSGRILINPERLKTWLDSIAPERRRQAVRSMLSEERIHLATPPDAALSYGATLTAAEKLITQRIYGGKHWRQNPLNDLQLGHEALRYRMQQLTRMTPREVAEAALRERWTVQGLDIVARTIQGTREALGTKASKEGLAILGQIEKNLGIAQAAVASGAGTQPGVTMKEREVAAPEGLTPDDFSGARYDGETSFGGKKVWRFTITDKTAGDAYDANFTVKAGSSPEHIRRQMDLKKSQFEEGAGLAEDVAVFEDLQAQEKKMLADGKAIVNDEFSPEYMALRKEMEAIKNRHGGMPPKMEEAPGVRQKKGREDTSDLFLPPLAKSPAPEAPAEITPKGISDLAAKIIAEPQTERKFSRETKAGKDVVVPPSFEQFADQAKKSFGGQLEEGQLRAAWEDAIHEHIAKASGADLERLRTTLKLQRMGTRPIADVFDPTTRDARAEAGRMQMERLAENKDRLAANLLAKAEALKNAGIQREIESTAKVAESPRQKQIRDMRFRVEELRREARIARLNLRYGDESAKSVMEAKERLASKVSIEADRLAKLPAEASAAPRQETLGESILSPPSTLLAERAERLRTEAAQLRASPEMLARTGVMTPEMRRAQNYRNVISRAIREKLLTNAPEERTPAHVLHRADISPQDVGWEVPSRYGSWRQLSSDEAKSPSVVSRIVQDGARTHGEDVSATRRLLVMVNPESGTVHVVSAYPHGREGAMAVNPLKAMRASKGVLGTPIPEGSRVNEPLADVMKMYRPFESILLNDPVKNFYRRFSSVAEYTDALGSSLRIEAENQASREYTGGAEMSRRIGGEGEYGEGVQEVFSPEAQGPSTMQAWNDMRRVRLQPEESGRLMDHIMDETSGKVSGPEDILQNLTEAAAAKNWDVLPAYQKIYDALRKANPDVPTLKIYEELLPDEIWKIVRDSKTRDEFVTRAAKGFDGESPETFRGEQEPPAPSARELTMMERVPPTVVRPEQIPPEAAAQMQQAKAAHEAAQAQLPPSDAPGMLVKDAREKVSFAKRMITDPAKGFARWYSEWMSNAVRSQGGPAAAQAADIADAIVDRAKLLYGRDLTPTLDRAKELAGGAPRRPIIGQVPSPTLISANKWLNEMDHPVSERTGVANVVGAIENTKPVPASAQRTVDAARAANLEAGRMVQPVTPGFVATGKFQRNLTGFGYDILTEGPTSTKPTDLWNIYTRDTAILNHAELNAARVAAGQPALTVRQAIRETRKFFMDWRNELRDPAPDANRLERINQDYSRFYPKAITHVRTAAGWQEMMHTTLFNYLENVAQRAAHARAFREQFPNNAAGKLAFAQLDAGVRGELPATSIPYWDSLVKTIQGRPTDTYAKAGFLRPGQPWGEFLKGLNQTVISGLKRLALTGQMVTQTPETIFGSGLAELGMKNRLRSLARLKQLWPEMEKQGQVNQLLYDWSYDPNAPIRSAFRSANNLLSKGFALNFLNEFQGRLGAAIARSAADRVRNQATEPLTAWEKRQYPETFRKMQFTPEQVNALMAGDPILLNVFERRAPAWLTTENRAATETSMAGNNRLLNSVFPFQMYPMNKMNQFRRNYLRLGEAWRTGDKQQRIAALEGLGRFLFTNTAQGAAYVALAAYAFGGKEGVEIKKNEAMDEPFEFLAESLIATLGGPYYLLWQGARRNGVTGITEQGTRMLFPYTQAADLNDMLQGNGQYRDQDINRRIGRYVQQKTPGFRIAKNALSIFGLSNDSGPTEQAIKGLYRWKLDTYGPDNSRFESPESRRVFRNKMRKAVDALKAGSLEDYERALDEAREASLDPTSVGSSFRARKVLKNNEGAALTDEEMDALTERIGEQAVERLQDYDAMLEWAARGRTPRSLK